VYYQVTEAQQAAPDTPALSLSLVSTAYNLRAAPPLKRKSSAFGRFGPLPPPERTINPLLAALLTPPPPGKPLAFPPCLQPLQDLLSAGKLPPEQLNHTAVFASWGEQPLRGTAMHAAIFGLAACSSGAASTALLNELIGAGVDVNAGMVAEGAPAHWLNGATALHLVTLLAMHHGTAAHAMLTHLLEAGADRCVFSVTSHPRVALKYFDILWEKVLCGATALYLVRKQCLLQHSGMECTEDGLPPCDNGEVVATVDILLQASIAVLPMCTTQ
jgi:hypothetical protein